MERISIQDIAAILTTKSGLKKKEAERFAMMIFDVVKDGLASDRLVKIKGLGTFKVIDIDSRESINVNTGKRVLIEGHDKITFTPDATMKELVNKPFSQFETVVLNDGVEFDDTETAVSEFDNADADAETDDEAVTEPDKPVVAKLLELPVEESPIVKPPVVEPPVEKLPVEELPVEEEPVEEPPVEEPLVEQADSPPSTGNNLMEELPIEGTEEETELETINEEKDMNSIKGLEDATPSNPKRTQWVVLSLIACAVSFAAGYYFGYQKGSSIVMDKWVDDTEVMDTVKTDTTSKDTLAKKAVATTKVEKAEQKVAEPKVAEPEKAEPKKAEPKKAEPEKTVAPAQEATAGNDKYEQMDARVRTGAYRIIGTDHEVKVKAGETLTRICRRTLGPDMECYIEVYNGLPRNAELKEGQKLKIPKIELKKKKPQTTN